MTHRERFRNSVLHRQTDRAVFDICGSPQMLVDYQVTKAGIYELLEIFGEKHGHFCMDERACRP